MELLFLCQFAGAVATSKEIFVAPHGSASGSGSRDQPLDLATALSQRTPASAGDIVWLRGGTYRGKFRSLLNGAAGMPITISSHPGEWAVIDSGLSADRDPILQVRGGWMIFRDFEIMSSDPKRTTRIAGSSPSDIRRGEGVDVRAPGIRLINLVVHDAELGIGLWSEGPDAEVSGCVIYHNGWQGPDRAHGHGIYAQNRTGSKWIRNNTMFSQFDKGLHIYGSSKADLRNFLIEENTIFNSGFLSVGGGMSENLIIYGGATGPEHIVIKHNLFYGSNLRGKLVIGGEGADDLIFQSNYVPHSVNFAFWKSLVVTRNVFARGSRHAGIQIDTTASDRSYLWNNNVFFSSEPGASPFTWSVVSADGSVERRTFPFDDWQRETGFDLDSLYVPALPGETDVFVRTNRYEIGRAQLVVYNWRRAPVVPVDVTGVLRPGQLYEIFNAQNYPGPPIVTGTFDGFPIRIPQGGLKAARPVGFPQPPSTAPEFNVFIMRLKPPIANNPPLIAEIPDLVLGSNAVSPIIPVTVHDHETAPEQLHLFASAADPELVPEYYILFGSSGAQRAMIIIPSFNRTGSTTIFVFVSDGMLTTTTTFTVTVAAEL